MTCTRSLLTSVLVATVLALAIPFFARAAVTCVNGQLTADDGSVTGTCDGSIPNTPDPNAPATGTANLDYSNTLALQRDGVFGCSLNGSYSMSVGALSATGGVYVPVNDAAVTLNTGYLVYKECVLRGVVDRERENATAALQKQILNDYITGNGGLPYFSQNITVEQRKQYFQTVVQNLQNGVLSGLNPAFKTAVTNAAAKGFASALNTPYSDFTCPYTGDLNSVLSGHPSGSYWDGYTAAMNPSCNPYFSYQMATAQMQLNAQNDVSNMMTQLQWYNGNYPRTTIDPSTGLPMVTTPGSVIGADAVMALQTGFVQQQNANDIDQMVGALFSGIASQVVGDNRGLAGLVQTTGSQPSYLDKVVSESTQGLRNSAVNAALQILNAAQQVEAGYKSAMEGIANVLLQTIGQLRSKENACWNLIIQKECSGSLAADNTCSTTSSCTTDPSTGQQTCTGGDKLKVATSTAFSQQVIDSQITPLASSTATNIQASATAIGLITQLIQGVTNSSSVEAQRIALQQLDTLVSQKALHTQYDLQNAQQQQTALQDSMAQLIQDTIQAWGDSTDPNTGWCNVNNSAVIDYWHKQWSVNK